MSKLEDDLNNWTDEAFTKADAWAAVKYYAKL